MKRIAVIMFILGMCAYTNSQINPRTIGLRLGGGSINSLEFSYQHKLKEANRLEADLALGFGYWSGNYYSSISFGGIYHWVWNITEGLNWYVGPGAMVGLTSSSTNSSVNLGIGGQIGIEYDFNDYKLPLLISLDTRPMWDFIGRYGDFGWGAALGIRYIWNK